MQVIIPAKACSERVKRKNFREFTPNGRSLVDLTIGKLLAAGMRPDSIWLSCEDRSIALEYCDRYCINWHLRPEHLCGNSVPLTTWMREIVGFVWREMGGQCEIAWAQVCDPFFDDYSECFSRWEHLDRSVYDSLVVCHPWRGYLLDFNKKPVGWGFGEFHTPSQRLPYWYTMPFTLSLLTPQAIERTSYHVGASPYWHVSRGEQPAIDIDTEQDFRIAQLYWAEVNG